MQPEELIAAAMCTRTWGHTDDGIPCSACRKEAALLVGQIEGRRMSTEEESTVSELGEERVPVIFEIIPKPWGPGWDVMRLSRWDPAQPGQVGSSGYEWVGSAWTRRGAERVVARLWSVIAP